MSQEKIGLWALRLGLVAVYVYFGISQLQDISGWVGLIPEWITTTTGIPAETIVMANAVFELVFAALLFFGIWIRFVSFVLAAHLAVITYIVGYNATGVRDFGLTMATLAHGLLEKKRR